MYYCKKGECTCTPSTPPAYGPDVYSLLTFCTSAHAKRVPTLFGRLIHGHGNVSQTILKSRLKLELSSLLFLGIYIECEEIMAHVHAVDTRHSLPLHPVRKPGDKASKAHAPGIHEL